MDIFSICVFNNLQKFSLIILPPFFPHDPAHRGSTNYINFNGIGFCKIFAIHR